MAIPESYNQNEFYTEIMNLIITQYINDSLSFIDPLARVFYRSDVTSGDQIAMYTADVVEETQYTDGSKTLLSVFTPTEDVQVLDTKDKIFFALTNNRFIGRGAFSTPTNLAEFINYMIGMLTKSKELYTYTKILADINAMATADDWLATQTITVKLKDTAGLSGADLEATERRNAKILYKRMIRCAKDMQRPSRAFNELEYMQTTDKDNLLCIINNYYDTDVTVEVMASLLNSDKISEDKVWGEKIFIPRESLDQATTVGYLMDRRAYVIANRILTATAFFNARSLNDTNFLHLWLIRGVIKGMQKVKFVAQYE
jgi:hypothetical protein